MDVFVFVVVSLVLGVSPCLSEIRVHDKPTYVELEKTCDHKGYCDPNNRVEKYGCVLEKRQDIIPEKSDVQIIAESESISGIGKQSEDEAVAHKEHKKEILDNVKDDEKGEKRVAMNIKRVQPFHFLLCRVAACIINEQIMVCKIPA